MEPSKPSKLGFDGFVGSIPAENQKIQAVSCDAWEWIEERAAILEFDAGVPRETANVRAFELWFRLFIGEMIRTNTDSHEEAI